MKQIIKASTSARGTCAKALIAYNEMIEEVITAVAQWPQIVAILDIPQKTIRMIGITHRLI